MPSLFKRNKETFEFELQKPLHRGCSRYEKRRQAAALQTRNESRYEKLNTTYCERVCSFLVLLSRHVRTGRRRSWRRWRRRPCRWRRWGRGWGSCRRWWRRCRRPNPGFNARSFHEPCGASPATCRSSAAGPGRPRPCGPAPGNAGATSGTRWAGTRGPASGPGRSGYRGPTSCTRRPGSLPRSGRQRAASGGSPAADAKPAQQFPEHASRAAGRRTQRHSQPARA